MRDIALLRRVIPVDAEPTFEWRTSFSGTPCYRMSAVTQNVQWVVDFYSGHFYRTQLEGSTGEVWRDLRSLAGFLRKWLNLGPLETES
jgi:hypothetical protein